MKAILKRFFREKNGATAIEYALICGLIFLAVIFGARNYASQQGKMYNYISTTVQSAINS